MNIEEVTRTSKKLAQSIYDRVNNHATVDILIALNAVAMRVCEERKSNDTLNIIYTYTLNEISKG